MRGGGVVFDRLLLLAIAISLASQSLPVTASVCPLDLSWSDLASAATACSDPKERAKCCRYMNALIAVSVARYADSTGQLGVPAEFSDNCVTYISETLERHGFPSNAMLFCGLGTKIVVDYECRGTRTVLEMLQSPNFTDVVNDCKTPLSVDSICRKCLNTAITHLHRLIRPENSITLSTCRNAAFVALANNGNQVSTVDIASCLFGIHGLGFSTGTPPLQSPAVSPGPMLDTDPAHHPLIGGVTVKKRRYHSYHLTPVQGVGIGVTISAVLLFAVMVLLIHKKRREFNDATCLTEETQPPSPVFPPPTRNTSVCPPPSMFKKFGYKETKKATCNFSSVLGRGGFGTVYKARFVDGSLGAVKQMDKEVSNPGENEFCREMELIGRLHHRHLVALKGFCIDRRHRFLVYEYMGNGSLKDHLHPSWGRSLLSWGTRMRIAIDVANALEYLHFYCDPPLCHRDIKSSNILLDDNFTAKVADFGLAQHKEAGGYMDPEYVVTRELTEKSDVYSYGVLLLELVTGRRAIQDKKNLVEWSQKLFETDTQRLPEFVDANSSDDLDQLQIIIGIAQWCTQSEGRARPSIKQVLGMLYEGLDPVQREFARAIRDNADQAAKPCPAGNLMSSSSTSRSYCSRSFLLESASPQSPPPGNLSS